MTQDDIVIMAINAGANAHFVKHHIAFIEAFAKLVDDKTRRELREEIVYTWVPPHFVDLAVQNEREECAKVCETRLGPTATDFYGNVYAQAIRARGEA